MSSTTDKIRGTANEAVGSLKRSIGRVTGNRDLQAEGVAQQTKGRTQKTVGEAKDGIRNVADRINKSL